MARNLEDAYKRCYSVSRYAKGRTDYYGIEVFPESEDGCTYKLRITFKSGERYCCMELGCHFDFWRKEGWQRLRRELASLGLADLGTLRISSLEVHVEEGACFGLRFPGDGDTHLQPAQKAWSSSIGPFEEAEPRLTDEMRCR